jgi:hypothetical protein
MQKDEAEPVCLEVVCDEVEDIWFILRRVISHWQEGERQENVHGEQRCVWGGLTSFILRLLSSNRYRQMRIRPEVLLL